LGSFLAYFFFTVNEIFEYFIYKAFEIIREIEDHVISELSEFEKMTVARHFSLYAFLTLEKTAERLFSLNPSNLQFLSTDLSITVAECVLIKLTAIYLEQQVVTAASKHSLQKIPLDENSLKCKKRIKKKCIFKMYFVKLQYFSQNIFFKKHNKHNYIS
jgi:hypothetical protein